MVKFDGKTGDKALLRNTFEEVMVLEVEHNEQQGALVICDFPTPRDHGCKQQLQYFLRHFSTRMNEQTYQHTSIAK